MTKSWRLTEAELEELQAVLGLQLKDAPEVSLAFVHRSYRNESADAIPPQVVPLDILGGHLITLMILGVLLDRFPRNSVGEADRVLQSAVRKVPESMAERLGLEQYIRTGNALGGPLSVRTAALRGLLGAIYLQAGYDAVRRLITPFVEEILAAGAPPVPSYKILLQEYVHSRHGQFQYDIVLEAGPAHERLYIAEVSAFGHHFRGEGRSKKGAEEAAAQLFMERVAQRWLQERTRLQPVEVKEPRLLPVFRKHQLLPLIFDLGLLPDSVDWLHMALSHSSAQNERLTDVSNERLIPLGAYAIGTALLIYSWMHRDQLGGTLDPETATLQQGSLLSVDVRSGAFGLLHLERFLLVGKGTGGADLGIRNRADCVSALVGAIFMGTLEGGADPCMAVERFVAHFFIREMRGLARAMVDPTTLLQNDAALFGCRIRVDYEGYQGSPQDGDHQVQITLIDEATDHATPLAWKGSGKNRREATRHAGFRAVEELSSKLNLSRQQEPRRLWSMVVARLLRRLSDKGTRIQVKRKIAILLGGLGLDQLQVGDIAAAFGEIERVLSNLNAAGLPQREVLKAILQQVGPREAVTRETIVGTFQDLGHWVVTLTPQTVKSDVDAHLDAVVAVLEVAKSVVNGTTTNSIDLHDLVDRLARLNMRGQSIYNAVPAGTTLLGHDGVLITVVSSILTILREAAPGAICRVMVSHDEPSSAKICVQFGLNRSLEATAALYARLESVRTLLYIHYGELELNSEGIIICLHQPSPLTSPALQEFFADMLQANMASLAQLSPVAREVHDLRNELQFLRRAVERGAITEIDTPFLDARSSLRRITDAVLHYAESTAEPNYTEVGLHDLAAFVLRQVRSQIDGTGVALKHRAVLDRDTIVTDEKFLHSIVLNLAKNAVEAMPEGGRLDLDMHIGNDALLLVTVRDTGQGIPMDRVATLFSHPSTTKRQSGGSGLGLVTVYRYVKSLGGDISVRSTVGVGTEFVVLIPVGGVGASVADEDDLLS